MSGKRVPIPLKPGVQKRAEEWVTESAKPQVEEGAPVSMKRLTIDVPGDLHQRFKVQAAIEGMKMADLVRHWIEEWCGRN